MKNKNELVGFKSTNLSKLTKASLLENIEVLENQLKLAKADAEDAKEQLIDACSKIDALDEQFERDADTLKNAHAEQIKRLKSELDEAKLENQILTSLTNKLTHDKNNYFNALLLVVFFLLMTIAACVIKQFVFL